MLLKFFGNSINEKHLWQIISVLNNDGVVVLPTDTVYAFAGNIYSNVATEKICRIKNIKPNKANFSFLCHDLSNISSFTTPFSTEVFRLMKNSLPGPYTFILNANSKVPAIFKSNKKTIGIRVPDNAIAIAILAGLGNPLMVSSVKNESDEYVSDPDEIHERYKDEVDLVVDGGPSLFMPSTIIDCTREIPEVVREGKGDVGSQ